MAVLDPRLLDLIQGLMNARLDWLAIELVEGIQAGWQTEESEESLAEARARIGGNAQPKAHSEPRAAFAQARPIEGDEQIAWAADYVGQRLEAALAQLDTAVETLDLIVDGVLGLEDTITLVQPAEQPRPRARASVLLVDDESERKVDRDAIEQARAVIPALLDGLALWSLEMRRGIRI